MIYFSYLIIFEIIHIISKLGSDPLLFNFDRKCFPIDNVLLFEIMVFWRMFINGRKNLSLLRRETSLLLIGLLGGKLHHLNLRFGCWSTWDNIWVFVCSSVLTVFVIIITMHFFSLWIDIFLKMIHKFTKRWILYLFLHDITVSVRLTKYILIKLKVLSSCPLYNIKLWIIMFPLARTFDLTIRYRRVRFGYALLV